MNYRVHNKGKIHYLHGICYARDRIMIGNYFDVWSIEEAKAELQNRGVSLSYCKRCMEKHIKKEVTNK